MARPKKGDRKPQNPTDVDIEKLDQELEKDVAKSIGFGNEEDVVVEDANSVDITNENNRNEGTTEDIVNHGYEMPPSNNPLPEEEDNDDTPNIAHEIPTSNFNPLEEEVKERDYTHFTKPNQMVDSDGVPKPEPIIPEPVNVATPLDDTTIIGGDVNSSQSNSTQSNTPKQPSEPKRPDINPKLEDLSPSQKRKAAEQSADALLLAYGNIAPIPFKKISSFNLGKLDNSHLKGEIDKDMVISDDGLTVKKYCEGVNEQVEQTFEITQEMKDEIRPPLIDVLLENNFALTPTQRLLMAVGGQIVTMGLTAVQFMQQNKAAMNQFKVFHKENKESRAAMSVKETVVLKQEPLREQQYEYRTEKQQQQQTQYETIIPEPEIKTETTKKVEDYISNNSSGITVEEFPNED